MKPEQNWILDDAQPLLHKPCLPLDVVHINEQDQTLINKMVAYVDACFNKKDSELNIRPGIALAGNQVGLNKQVIYIHFAVHDTEHKYLLANPRIIAESQLAAYIHNGEGCLSVNKEHKGIIKRKNHIIVKAYDLFNHKEITIDASGLLAICLQHEIDHLYGILYYDRINNKQDTRDWIRY